MNIKQTQIPRSLVAVATVIVDFGLLKHIQGKRCPTEQISRDKNNSERERPNECFFRYVAEGHDGSQASWTATWWVGPSSALAALGRRDVM